MNEILVAKQRGSKSCLLMGSLPDHLLIELMRQDDYEVQRIPGNSNCDCEALKASACTDCVNKTLIKWN